MTSTTVLTYGELFALKTAGAKYVEHTVTEILSEYEDGLIPSHTPTKFQQLMIPQEAPNARPSQTTSPIR
jgi:hypothetical protein